MLDRSASLMLSVAIMALAVNNTKILTNRVRPNGENQHSFPSGHTATAFMLAEFLNQNTSTSLFGIALPAIVRLLQQAFLECITKPIG